MSRSQPPLQQHLLTRSDLARIGVPAGEILGWLAEGDIEQVGALAGSHGEDPVFTVAPRLRDALADRLARIGKTAVVLSPLRVRSFLLRSLLHGSHPPLDPGTAHPTPPVTSEVPAEALAQHLLTTDLAQVLHEAAEDLDADVAAMLQLAQEEARLELAKATAEPAKTPADEPPAFADAPEADDEAPAEEEECFDVDDLSELFEGFGDEPSSTPEPTEAPPDEAAAAHEPADALAPAVVDTSRNEPFPVTAPPPAADPVQESTMPSTHASHTEPVTEPVHDDESVASMQVAADREGVAAPQVEQATAPDEADERAAMTEAAAVLEQLLGDSAPSTPFLQPHEIQSALAAFDIDEPAPTRSAVVAHEQAVVPAATVADAGTPTDDASSADAQGTGTGSSRAGAAGAVRAEAAVVEPTAAAASDAATEPSADASAEHAEAPLAEAVAPSPAVPPKAKTEAAPGVPVPMPEFEPAAASDQESPAPAAGTHVENAHGHEVLGAAMQRVDAFLDRLKAALVEMAARPTVSEPTPAPVPAAAPLDMAPLVGAIDGGFAKAVQQSEATAHVLTGLAERIEGLGQRLEASTGATVAAMQTAPAMSARPTAPQFVMPRSNAVPLVLLAVAGLVTAWSVLFWFKTGSPRLALGTLIGANLVGCCLLAARR